MSVDLLNRQRRRRQGLVVLKVAGLIDPVSDNSERSHGHRDRERTGSLEGDDGPDWD